MKKFLFITSIYFLCLQCSLANDTSGRIAPTGGIVFEKQENIKMEQESLFLSGSTIEVNYLFRNTSDKDITVKVFFPLPEMNCQKGSYGLTSPANYNFRLWVNGLETQHNTHLGILAGVKDFTKEFSFLLKNYYDGLKTEQILEKIGTFSEEDQSLFFGENRDNCVEVNSELGLDFCHLSCKIKVNFYWEQTFPAGKTVHIRHSYTPESFGDSMGGFSFGYILKTANNWQTPIGQFNALIMGGTICEDGFAKQYIAKDIKNFIPTEDISVTGQGFYWSLDGWGYCEKDEPKEWNVNKIVCSHPDGCFFHKEKDKQALCIIKGDKGMIIGELDSSKEWIKTVYGGGGYFKLAEKIVEKDRYGFGETIYKLEGSPVAANKKIPLCTDYFEQLYGDEKMVPQLYRIDGPANIRLTSNGKVTAKLADGTYVWAVSQQGDWYNVIQNETRGWTHKDNLIDIWTVK